MALAKTQNSPQNIAGARKLAREPSKTLKNPIHGHWNELNISFLKEKPFPGRRISSNL